MFTPFHKKMTVLALCALFLSLSGCAAVEKNENKELSLVVDMGMFSEIQGGLLQAELGSFRLLIHEYSPPSDSSNDVLFDSECLPFQPNALFEINNLKAGSGRSINLEAFRDAECTEEELGARAYRGGVTIDTSDTPLRYVLIPYGTEEFTALPIPSEATVNQASETSCETDAECQEAVHPRSFCWQASAEGKQCAMTTLFPLNNYVPRAMHTSVTLDDGSIVTVGGIGQTSSGVLLGTDTTFEIFSPSDNLFEVPSIKGYSGQVRMLLHETIAMGGQKILILGGIQSMVLQSRDDGSLSFITPTQACWDPNNCYDNILNTATAVSFDSGNYKSNSLPGPVFGTRAMPISGNGSRILVVGGAGHAESSSKCSSSDNCDDGEWCNNGDCVVVSPQYKRSIFICAASQGSLTVSCEDSELELSEGRFGHELFCLEKDDDGKCTKVVIAGGYGVKGENIAELYDVESGELSVLESDSPDKSVGGWKWIETAEGEIFSFGGSADFGATATETPQRVVISDGTISFEELKSASNDATLRTFHEVVAMADGSIMLVGGLDSNNAATDSVLIVGQSGSVEKESSLNSPRFAASATLLTQGPLSNAVVIQGGFSLSPEPKALEWTDNGAELYVPIP